MITREQIEAEAAFIQSLMRPTGTNHTPTPWQARGSRGIVSGNDRFVAGFNREEDRNLALYFVNAHPGILSLLRGLAGAFEFIAQSTDDQGLRHYASERAASTRIYADLFAGLGKPVPVPDVAPLDKPAAGD